MHGELCCCGVFQAVWIGAGVLCAPAHSSWRPQLGHTSAFIAATSHFLLGALRLFTLVCMCVIFILLLPWLVSFRQAHAHPHFSDQVAKLWRSFSTQAHLHQRSSAGVYESHWSVTNTAVLSSLVFSDYRTGHFRQMQCCIVLSSETRWPRHAYCIRVSLTNRLSKPQVFIKWHEGEQLGLRHFVGWKALKLLRNCRLGSQALCKEI